MKRSESLQTLSREHLSALILASCLKNGKSSNPRYPWPGQVDAQVQKVLYMWEQELHWHFEAEELFFFKAFHADLSESMQALGLELLQDHHDIKSSIQTLAQLPENELPEKLIALGHLLEAHVRREENVYFEGLQTEIDALALQQAHRALLNYYEQRPAYQCVFTGETRQAEKLP